MDLGHWGPAVLADWVLQGIARLLPRTSNLRFIFRTKPSLKNGIL